MKRISRGSADIIIRALEDVRVMLANWPASPSRPEFNSRIKELRQELKNAAKVVEAAAMPVLADLFEDESTVS